MGKEVIKQTNGNMEGRTVQTFRCIMKPSGLVNDTLYRITFGVHDIPGPSSSLLFSL